MAKTFSKNSASIITILFLAIYYLFGCAVPSPKSTKELQQHFITIGTGGVTGVYYPTGDATCSLVNKGTKQHGVRCGAESTNAAAFTI